MPTALRSLACLLLTGGLLAPAFAANTETHDTTPLLQELRAAYGGAPWDGVHGLAMDGKETRDGLTGVWRMTIDLRNGYFASHARNALFSVGDGYDVQGRWTQDPSGQIHPYDSDEAKAATISENWLQRFGFLWPQQQHVTYRALSDVTEDGRHYSRLEATPKDGRTMTLWIDPTTHRLDRAVWQRSFLIVTQRFTDYRNVSGLWLPYRIATTPRTVAGGEDDARVDLVDHYQLLDAIPGTSLQRPDNTVRDVTMMHGATQAVTPMHLEGGVLLIDVSINGKGPMPFLLDTGAQAILTVDTAKKLGFHTEGQGSSAGSGPGTISTAYTRVDHLTIGDADIQNLSFLVMPFPYSSSQRGNKPPIAGLLGLEIFERFAVTFDYDHQQLVLQPFDHGSDPATVQGNTLPLRFTNDLPLAQATLDGKTGMFDIDTGNSTDMLIYPQWAEREGLLRHYAKGVPILIGGVGGKFFAHNAHIRSLQLGDDAITDGLAQLTRADAGATGNTSEAGNIGQDILSRFNLHIDYRRQQLVLMPRHPSPIWHGAQAGFDATKKEVQPDRYIVTSVVPNSPAEHAGLHKDDAIIAVDDKPAASIGAGDMSELCEHQPDGMPTTLHLADGRTLTMAMRDIAP